MLSCAPAPVVLLIIFTSFSQDWEQVLAPVLILITFTSFSQVPVMAPILAPTTSYLTICVLFLFLLFFIVYLLVYCFLAGSLCVASQDAHSVPPLHVGPAETVWSRPSKISVIRGRLAFKIKYSPYLSQFAIIYFNWFNQV
jgi:hypothetical protein